MRTTVDEALSRFTLIGGSGSEAGNEACAMSLLAWLDECDEWTDHPQCAHGLIADTVIRGNDAAGTTAEMRAELVRLGVDGVLDTWWVPTEVVVWAMAGEPGETVTAYQRAERMLRRVAAWKQDRQRPNLADANLADANLTRADLTGANLTRAYLAGAYLTGADLTGAYLTRAYLADANLTDAYLTRANLTRANLTGANLTRADLTDAYLTGAYLAGAYLAGANLTGADLTGANLADANLADANLTDADLTGANLTRAYLAGARGTPRSGMPTGWALNDAGLWVKA